MSEMALVSSKRSRLQSLIERGSSGATKALSLQASPANFFSTIQVGITSIAILSGIVGEKALIEPITSMLSIFGMTAELSKSVASVLTILILTFLSVVFGEIIPKRIGLMMPEKISSMVAIPMYIILKVFSPVVWIFSKSSQTIIKLLGLDKIEPAAVTNEEVKDLVGQGVHEGVFHESEKQIISNVLHMDEKRCSTIMTHKSDIVAIDLNVDYEENLKLIMNSEFSRVIVTNGSFDKVSGFIHIISLMQEIKDGKTIDFEKHMEKILYVPQSATATQVLESFKKYKKEMAIVINEYGDNLGIITMHDIMNSVVGIDSEPDEGNSQFKKRDDGSYLVDGSISLEDLAHHLNIREIYNIDTEIHTLNGLIMSEMGCVPEVGQTASLEINEHINLDIEIVDMDKNCIDKIILKITDNRNPVNNSASLETVED